MIERNLTVNEVATIFKKSKRTIYRWLDDGRVFERYIKVKDGVLIPQSEVERILNKNEIKIETV